MVNWYEKYMNLYGQPFSKVPESITDCTRKWLVKLQSEDLLACIVEIAYNKRTARRCGLLHCKGKDFFDVDSDTLSPKYYELMLGQLLKPGVVAVSATWDYFPDVNIGHVSYSYLL